ncbi:OmpA family protein [Parahaliea mediterranea]|uniref:OmpA family protein n=1 Tax=Parahaliea mediterranea TaxID=651086 RepID=UPI0013009409|nr:OmpA family protein [Parahaliea mediterranea]
MPAPLFRSAALLSHAAAALSQYASAPSRFTPLLVAGLLLAAAGCSQNPPAGGSAPRPPAPPQGPALPQANSDTEVASQLARATARHGNALPADTVGYYLDIQTAKLQTLYASGVQIQRQSDHIRLTLPGGGSFDTGSSRLSPAVHRTLDTLAGVLREYDQSLVLVAGHSDNQGDAAFNLRLSRERAMAVGRYLNAQGVQAQRIVVRGFGDSQPVADNNTPEGRSANRRIELELWPLAAPAVAAGTS